MGESSLENWQERFEADPRCTLVTPGPRPKLSRDPDDNIFLATARAGHAEVPDHQRPGPARSARRIPWSLPFAIVTPREFLDQFE
jgi:predicted nucleic acid-binding protein